MVEVSEITATSAARTELVGLTAWRGISALLVVVYHLEIVYDGIGVPLTLGPLEGIVTRGYVFVDLFFLLSGFVIAHVYGQKNLLERGAAKRFIALRVGRIYPMHLFVLALLLILPIGRAFSGERPIFRGDSTAESLLTEVLLLDSVGIHDSLTWNEVSWSVSAEWISYLLAPILLILARAKTRPGVVAVVAAALWAGLFIITQDGSLNHATSGLGWLRGAIGFTLGICLYRLHSSNALVRLSRIPAAPGFAFACVLLGASFAPNDALLTPLFAALIVTSAAARGRSVRTLESGPMRWLGEISYSVYLLQQIFLISAPIALRSMVTESTSSGVIWTINLIGLTVLLGVSTLTYRRIEVPARDAVRSRVHPSNVVTMPTTTQEDLAA